MARPEGPRVAVVGAGVAGLVCARELERAGARAAVFELAPRVGGRLQTDDVEGYQLDVGFQVLIDSYPEVRKQLDLRALNLRKFWQGALLAQDGLHAVVANPITCPSLLIPTIRTAVGWGLFTVVKDVLRLLRLILSWLFTSPYEALERSRLPAAHEAADSFLAGLGLSGAITQGFLRPFFEAIYVSPLGEQSSLMFQFVLRMLATGGACLPARGMRAVPEQLAARLAEPVQLGVCVEAVEPDAVKVRGQWQSYAAVVVAADWPRARDLLPSLPAVHGTRSATFYFGFVGDAPIDKPLIILQSYRSGPKAEATRDETRVVNIGFPSVVQPSYAPQGHSLAAVTVMGKAPEAAWVLAEVERILGVACSAWRHLRTYDIGFHQPAQWPLAPFVGSPAAVGGGAFCCGDHRGDPTLDGAMRSGARAAQAVLAHLAGAAPSG